MIRYGRALPTGLRMLIIDAKHDLKQMQAALGTVVQPRGPSDNQQGPGL